MATGNYSGGKYYGKSSKKKKTRLNPKAGSPGFNQPLQTTGQFKPWALSGANAQTQKKSVGTPNTTNFVDLPGGKTGTKIDRYNLRRAFNKAVKKAEIEDFKFHDLRHCFCTKLAQRGVDIYKIAKLAGHEDIRMTQRYSHHCPESLRDGVEILEVDCKLTATEKKEQFETSQKLS